MLTTVRTDLFAYATTQFKVDPPAGPCVPGPVLTIGEGNVSALKLFVMSGGAGTLRRLRDAIDAHLGETVADVQADASAALYAAVEDVIGETPHAKPSPYVTTSDPDEAFAEGQSVEGWRLGEMLKAALAAYDDAEPKTEAA